MEFLVLITVIISLILLVKPCVVIVKQQETVIIERFGKYSRTLTPGLNFIIPIFDKPHKIKK